MAERPECRLNMTDAHPLSYRSVFECDRLVASLPYQIHRVVKAIVNLELG